MRFLVRVWLGFWFVFSWVFGWFFGWFFGRFVVGSWFVFGYFSKDFFFGGFAPFTTPWFDSTGLQLQRCFSTARGIQPLSQKTMVFKRRLVMLVEAS